MADKVTAYDDDVAACFELIKEGVEPHMLGPVSDLPWGFGEHAGLDSGRGQHRAYLTATPATSGSWMQVPDPARHRAGGLATFTAKLDEWHGG